ncbi:MAG: hypothetical protein IKI37_07385 [Oscillospiraceae bacterium]|nr:hypothetical protein [Oscillospiraceae bacterium]MBR7084983.1 hypothetical protein [Oscillospiraceae bacterium]
MKKWIILLCTACMLLTGCTTAKQQTNFTEAELPYGATMHADKNSYTVPMTWDRRFLDTEAVSKIADYIGSIQNQDGDLYQASSLPLYTDYQIQEVYDYQNTQELVDALHDGLVGKLAEDFQFDMIYVNELSQDRKSGGLSAMIDLLDKISENEKFSDKIQNAWSLQLEWEFSYNNGEGSGRAENQYIYLFQIDNQYYCCM